jgi:hypothetical protein
MGQSEYAFCFGNFIKEVGLRFFSAWWRYIIIGLTIQFVYVTAGIYFFKRHNTGQLSERS